MNDATKARELAEAPKLLRAWIRENGLRSDFVAAKIGVGSAPFSNWLCGHTKPTRKNRLALAEYTGLPIAYEEAWL